MTCITTTKPQHRSRSHPTKHPTVNTRKTDGYGQSGTKPVGWTLRQALVSGLRATPLLEVTIPDIPQKVPH